MASTAGGAAAVRTAAANPQGKGPAIELATPSFTGRITLDAERSRQLHAGQRATLWSSSPQPSILLHLWSLARRVAP